MAITDSQKVDYLFKKIGYSVTKTDTANVKSPSNESIASPLAIRGGSIWSQSDIIPNALPVSNSSVVALYNDTLTSTVEAVNDGTASANRTWKTNLTDWIDASFGSTYQVKVYLATSGNAQPQTYGTQLFADGSGNNDEWFFDYTSGVLNFIGTNLPSGSFTGKSIFISGARYIGNKGLGNLGNVTFNGSISSDSITVNTIYSSANLLIAPTGGYVNVNGSTLSNLANPTSNQDAVTVSYLNSALTTAGNRISTGDSEVRITDTGTANLTTTLDGNIVSYATVNKTTFLTDVNIGTLLLTGNTISSSGNIRLDAQGLGVVQILGTDALGVPAGGSGDRPDDPELGFIRFNTDLSTLEFWDGNAWTYPGAQTITSETITPDGVSNTFSLSSNVSSAYGLLVSINGTLQQPVTAYDVAGGNQLVFTEVPSDTDIIEVRSIATGITVTGMSYGSTEVQLTTGNVNIYGNLLPQANVTFDIGSDTLRWRDLYLAGNTINLGGATISAENGVLSFTPAGGSAINLSTDIDPSLLYSTNTNVKVTNNYVNVAIAGSNIAAFRASGLQLVGNISADGFNYSNGVSILDGVISLITSNAAVQAGLIAELTSNAAVQAGLITAAVTQADSNTANANLAMKGYVDAINSTLTANAALQAGNIATIQATYAQLSGATFTGAVAAPSLSLTSALPITSGGTGGTSASSALDNLLPSGEISGYVLKTSGAGSYYWSAETGGGSTVGTTINTSRVYFTANSGQTVYTGLSYTPGAGQLRVYINGVRQFDSAYTETNSSAFTLSTGVTSGTVVLAEVDGYVDFNAYANTTYSTPVGSISSTTVQDALAELDTEKAALSGAAFTGNVSTTGNVSITSSLQSGSSSTGALVVTGGVGIGGNLYVGGNLQVAGNVTYFNSNNVNFNDALIYLADDNSGDVLDIGFISSFTDAVRYQHTGLARDASDGTWKLFANVVAEPTTTVDFTNAQYSNLRIGNLTSINATLTGNLSAGNLNATNLTGTLATASQTNITSVGTLTGLTVSGAPVPNANVSVNLGGTSTWWNTFYANTHVGATATFTGNVTAGNFNGTLLTASQPNITSVGTLSTLAVSGLTTLAETTEILDTKSSVTGTVVHDFSTSAIWYYSSISGNVTANITNVPTTDNRVTSVSIVVNQGATGYIINGLQINGTTQTIRWQGNTVPAPSTNRIDVFTFSLIRAASAWTVLGSATSHG